MTENDFISADASICRAVVAMIEEILIPREVFNDEEAHIALNISAYFKSCLDCLEPTDDPVPWDETGLTPKEKEANDG